MDGRRSGDGRKGGRGEGRKGEKEEVTCWKSSCLSIVIAVTTMGLRPVESA
jgi:hypothetical protein